MGAAVTGCDSGPWWQGWEVFALYLHMFKKHFLFHWSAFDICNITTNIVGSDFIHSLIFTLQWNIFFFIQT